MKLFPYQKAASDRGVNAVHKSQQIGKPWNLIISSPTGTGKSVMELTLMHELEQRGLKVILVTPRVEVITSISRNAIQLGIQTADRLYTPMTYFNKLKKGTAEIADVLLLDEAHHQLAPTWSRLQPNICIVGFTATPMRGGELETDEWRRNFSEFYEALTITEAIKSGYLTNYYYFGNTIGLLDEKLGSEKQMLQSAAARLHDNMHLVFDWTMMLEQWSPQTRLFACPRKESVYRLCQHFEDRGAPKPLKPIIGDTRRSQREKLIKSFEAGECWLATVDVFTEGVDAPGGAYIDEAGNEVIWPGATSLVDLQPTESPVKMLQIQGRVLRCVRNSGYVGEFQKARGLSPHPSPNLPRFDIKSFAQIVSFTKNAYVHQERLKTLGVELVKRDIGNGFWVFEPNLDFTKPMANAIHPQNIVIKNVTPKTLRFIHNGSVVKMTAGLDGHKNWVVNISSPKEAPASYVLIGNQWKKSLGSPHPADFVLLWADSTMMVSRWLHALSQEYLINSCNPTIATLLCLAFLTEMDTVGIGGRSNVFQLESEKVQGLSAQQQESIIQVKNIAGSNLFREL